MADDSKAHLRSEEEEVKADTQPNISVDEETPEEDSSGNEQMVPKSRLDKVIEQREEALEKAEGTASELQALKEEIESLKQSIAVKPTQDSDAFTREEEEALAKIDRGLKQRGYVTKEELEEQSRAERRVSEIRRLKDTYKKGTGFPEFKTDEVLLYAKQNGFGDNLEAAYRNLHWDAIVQVAAQRQTNPEPPTSEKPTSGERQVVAGVTREKIAEMDVADWNKHGDSIMDKFKKSIFGK